MNSQLVDEDVVILNTPEGHVEAVCFDVRRQSGLELDKVMARLFAAR